MSLNTEKTKTEYSNTKIGFIVIIAIVIASLLSNCSSSGNDVPEGFSKDFYEGAVETFFAMEGNLWDNESPLSDSQQKWIQEYIFEHQDYSEKEKRAASALSNYLEAGVYMAGFVEENVPIDEIDNMYLSAYENAYVEVVESLELESIVYSEP